jgi:hypothetical protein
VKRSTLIALAVQTGVLFALPGMAQLVERGDVNFILTLLILMALHPLCCLGTGIFAGLDIKARWWLVLTGPVLALCGDLIFYDMEADFLFYVWVNLLSGVLGLGITALIKQLSKRYR